MICNAALSSSKPVICYLSLYPKVDHDCSLFTLQVYYSSNLIFSGEIIIFIQTDMHFFTPFHY